MTARQVIDEIKGLPPGELEEVRAFLQSQEREDKPLKYLDLETARPMIDQVLSEHAELFRKLAQ